MRKLKALGLFFIFAIALAVSGALHAATSILTSTTPYASCGAKPGIFDKFLTDAEKIRQKCIEDIYKENKEKTRLEVEELARTSANLSLEIKKVAIKSSVGLVQCTPRPGEPARDPKLIKKCNELVSMHNAVSDRMNVLTGWYDRGRPAHDDKDAEKAMTPPCPSSDKMAELRQAAIFNRKLFKTWEYCRTVMIDGM